MQTTTMEPPKLKACPDCGHQVSVRAAACPQCGCPIAATPPPVPRTQTQLPPPTPWKIKQRSPLQDIGAIIGISVLGIIILVSILISVGAYLAPSHASIRWTHKLQGGTYQMVQENDKNVKLRDESGNEYWVETGAFRRMYQRTN